MTLPVPETLEVLPISAFSDNYIWLIMPPPSGMSADADRPTSEGAVLPSSRDVIVVDPGQAEPVIAALQTHGLRLSAILLTHHHADHVGGVASLLDYAGNDVPVYGPAGESIAHVSVALSGGDRVTVPSLSAHFTVIDVPGHTRGHIAYVLAATASQPERLFCGDTLFACGCGRLFEGSPAQMQASLDKLAALPDDTAVHCAHEYTLSNIRFALACDGANADLLAWQQRASALRTAGVPTLPTTIAHERRVNPFLRVDQPALIDSLAKQSGRVPTDRLDAFTALRAWKDRF